MFPVILNGRSVRVALIGNGDLAVKRLRQLQESGMEHLQVFAPEPEPAMEKTAGDSLVRRLPALDELKKSQIVYVVDLDRDEAEKLAQVCWDIGTLVNVEDVIPLCDFHTPSQVRRGSFLLSVSTGGKSPGLARRVRRYLSGQFGPEWAERLEILAGERQKWRAAGLDMEEVARKTDEWIDEKNWLP